MCAGCVFDDGRIRCKAHELVCVLDQIALGCDDDPGALAQERSLRLAWFLDAGQVYDRTYALNDLRYATGFAFKWVSPFGPLHLSYAKALNAGPTDRLQQLQFTLGANF